MTLRYIYELKWKLKLQLNTNGSNLYEEFMDMDPSTVYSNAWLLCQNSADCIKIVTVHICHAICTIC